MKNFMKALAFAMCVALLLLLVGEASAQCANGNCSSRNATLGESISQLPAPVIPAPAPAPQIAYYTAPSGASASSSASTAPATGQLVVAGYTAPAPQMAYYTVPVNQIGFSVLPTGGSGGSAASASAGSAAASTSASTAPQLIGQSTQLACQNGGCGGRRFAPFQNIRARRTGNFAKSISISRS